MNGIGKEYLQGAYQILLPPKRKGETQSWAHSYSERISADCGKDSTYCKIASRVEAFFFPFVASCAFLQKLGVVMSSSTNYALGHQRVDESVSKELRECVLLAGAVILSIFTWLPSLISPDILARPDREERIKSDAEKQLAEALDKLESLRGTPETQEIDITIRSCPELDGSEATSAKVLCAFEVLNKVMGFTVFSLADSPEQDKATYTALKEALWSSKDPFEFQKITRKTVAPVLPHEVGYVASDYIILDTFKTPEKFLLPEGVQILEIDASKLTPVQLKAFLNLHFQIFIP